VIYIDPVEGDPLFCDLPPCGDETVDPVRLRVDATSPALPRTTTVVSSSVRWEWGVR